MNSCSFVAGDCTHKDICFGVKPHRPRMSMEIREYEPLSKHTTFKLGGRARYFLICSSVDDLKQAISFSEEKRLPIKILGGGSNVLFSDKDFPGVIIKMGIRGISIDERGKNILVSVGAGESWDELVLWSVNEGLGGIENLSGIPGSVGASPVQNIGAYGSELSEFIISAKIFDLKNKVSRVLSREECAFGYRDSLFKKDIGKNLIITSVTLTLDKEPVFRTDYKDLKNFFNVHGVSHNKLNLGVIRDAVLNIRKNKLPSLAHFGTAGSFFKNPIVTTHFALGLKEKYKDMPIYPLENNTAKISAAYLIDKISGLKGFSLGKSKVYDDQALVLVSLPGGNSEEIFSLAKLVKEAVFGKTGINLEEEVELLNF